MHIYHIQALIATSILLLATIMGLIKYDVMDKATRVLVILTLAALTTESIAWYAATYYHNNMKVYAIYSIIEAILVSLYFNQVITYFRKYSIGYFMAVATGLFGLFSFFFLRDENTTDSYFLTAWGLITMLCSLVYLVQSMFFGKIAFQRDIHFWFSLLFLFYSATTLLNWLPYDYLTNEMQDKWLIDRMLFAISQVSSIASFILFCLAGKFRRHASA